MPAYNANKTTNTPLTAIYPGDQPAMVVNAEQPIAGTKHQQVALGRAYGQSDQHQCYAGSSFPNGAPSAAAWKVQHAAEDVDSQYTDIANANSASVTPDNIMFATSLPFIRIVTTTQPDHNMTIKVGKVA
jgi:hypothetical protein